jgi:hypothetical protein
LDTYNKGFVVEYHEQSSMLVMKEGYPKQLTIAETEEFKKCYSTAQERLKVLRTSPASSNSKIAGM